MSRPRKPARILWSASKGCWLIIDGQTQVRTEWRDPGSEGLRGAEKSLGEYLRGRDGIISRTAAPEDITIGQALEAYAIGHGVHTAAPARIGDAIKALAPFWADLNVSAVSGASCRRYAKWREASDGTIRRELGTLGAALNYCRSEGYLTEAPKVVLPAKPAPKDRWLTRFEAYWLLRGARRVDKRGRAVT